MSTYMQRHVLYALVFSAALLASPVCTAHGGGGGGFHGGGVIHGGRGGHVGGYHHGGRGYGGWGGYGYRGWGGYGLGYGGLGYGIPVYYNNSCNRFCNRHRCWSQCY